MNNFKAARFFGWVAVAALGLGGCAASTDGSDTANDTAKSPVNTFDFGTCGWDDSVPPGSYANSCEDCKFANGTLSCTCAESSGLKVHAELELTSCPEDDIANCEGTLGVGSCYVILNKGTCRYQIDFGSSGGAFTSHNWATACDEYTGTDSARGQAECAAENGTWSNEPCSSWN